MLRRLSRHSEAWGAAAAKMKTMDDSKAHFFDQIGVAEGILNNRSTGYCLASSVVKETQFTHEDMINTMNAHQLILDAITEDL